MRNFKILFLLPLVLFACQQKEMTLEDLRKAKWDSLEAGVDYISKENEKGIGLKTDSSLTEFTMMGTTSSKFDKVIDSSYQLEEESKIMLSGILGSKIPDSRSGYLRIGLYEMLLKNLVMHAYLSDEYTLPGNFHDDSARLKNIPGIKDIHYISKEEAKKLLQQEEGDWSKLLGENPLPASIDITLDDRLWTNDLLKELKNSIIAQLPLVTDVAYPSFIPEDPEQYSFFRYKRVKK